MNLIQDPWLPFKLQDGSVQTLPMSAIGHADIVDFALPRADFQGAAYQFAIGLLQTVLAPEDEIAWIENFEQAPTEDELVQAFNKVQHAFNLSGDGPFFMQDYDPIEHGSLKSVSHLLIETPGKNGIDENKDHFIKRGQCDVMSQEMAALALFTLQLNGPPNKACKGGRVGLRGAGPLTTLVTPSTEKSSLWIKLWLNVMNLDYLKWNKPNFHDGSVFPWLAPTLSSVPKGKVSKEIYEHDVHPLHVYWAMPNRIRLKLEDGDFFCSISGEQTTCATRNYLILGHGNNYAGQWNHPLSPRQYNPKAELMFSLKGNSILDTYKLWLNVSFIDDSNKYKCAHVVNHFYKILPLFIEKESQLPSLWLFSYVHDKKLLAKIDGWYSRDFPLFYFDADCTDDILREVKGLTVLIDLMSKKALKYSKLALFGRVDHKTNQLIFGKKNPAGKDKTDDGDDFSREDDNSLSNNLLQSFWERTELVFFIAVAEIIENTSKQASILTTNQAKTWLNSLQSIALDLFDEYALSELGNARSMAKRIQARQALVGWLFGGKEIKAFMANHHIDVKKEIA
jgi:CRISPR system Cascade subunit CasA